MKASFKIRFLFLLVALLPTYCLSQNMLVDSLERIIVMANDDSARVLLLIELSEQYTNTGDNRSLATAIRALDLSNKLNYNLGKIESYRTIGDIHRERNNFSTAHEYLSKGLDIAEKLKQYEDRKAAIYNSIGHNYRAQGNYSDAVIYFYKSLPIFESLGNTAEVASCYNNLGI